MVVPKEHSVFLLCVFTLILLMPLCIVQGCVSYKEKEDYKKQTEFKYTVRVGSPAFGLAIGTDTFNINNNILYCIDRDGKQRILPISNVYEISTNKQ